MRFAFGHQISWYSFSLCIPASEVGMPVLAGDSRTHCLLWLAPARTTWKDLQSSGHGIKSSPQRCWF